MKQRHEYVIDRKNQEIQMLKYQMFKLEKDFDIERKDRLAGEIILCLVVFSLGIVAGTMISM